MTCRIEVRFAVREVVTEVANRLQVLQELVVHVIRDLREERRLAVVADGDVSAALALAARALRDHGVGRVVGHDEGGWSLPGRPSTTSTSSPWGSSAYPEQPVSVSATRERSTELDRIELENSNDRHRKRSLNYFFDGDGFLDVCDALSGTARVKSTQGMSSSSRVVQ